MNHEQTRILSAMRGPMALILWALVINGTPMGHGEICTHTGLSRGSVTEGLKKLEAQGLIQKNRRYQGWTITTKTCQLSLPGLTAGLEAGEPEVIEIEADAASAGASPKIYDSPPDQKAAEREGKTGSTKIYDSPEAERPKKSAKNGGSPKIYDSSPKIQDSPASLDSEVKDLSLLNLDSDSAPEIPKILAASRLLFGEAVYSSPEIGDPQLLLAWLANAYDRRERLDRPARLVFNRLKRGVQPDRPYLENPLAYLPPDFLQAAGLIAPAPPDPDPDPPVETPAPAESPALDTPDWRAWRTARDQVLAENPSSRPYLEGADLLAGENGAYTVGVASEYARQWLESRLSSTLARLLSGITGQTCQIQFIDCSHANNGDPSCTTSPSP